eukprot:2060430-Pyramimonas_sp.AAC.1
MSYNTSFDTRVFYHPTYWPPLLTTHTAGFRHKSDRTARAGFAGCPNTRGRSAASQPLDRRSEADPT